MQWLGLTPGARNSSQVSVVHGRNPATWALTAACQGLHKQEAGGSRQSWEQNQALQGGMGSLARRLTARLNVSTVMASCWCGMKIYFSTNWSPSPDTLSSLLSSQEMQTPVRRMWVTEPSSAVDGTGTLIWASWFLLTSQPFWELLFFFSLLGSSLGMTISSQLWF